MLYCTVWEWFTQLSVLQDVFKQRYVCFTLSLVLLCQIYYEWFIHSTMRSKVTFRSFGFVQKKLNKEILVFTTNNSLFFYFHCKTKYSLCFKSICETFTIVVAQLLLTCPCYSYLCLIRRSPCLERSWLVLIWEVNCNRKWINQPLSLSKSKHCLGPASQIWILAPSFLFYITVYLGIWDCWPD